jgi:hypothetical protein
MAVKVSGLVKLRLNEGTEIETVHIFKKNALTKQGLKLLSNMLSAGCMDDEGNVTKDLAKLADAGLEPMMDLYDKCIFKTE